MRNIASAAAIALASLPALAQHQQWLRQFGTTTDDSANAAAPDAVGGVIVTGTTRGNLGGPNAGALDLWMARYDAAGTRSWIRQTGSQGDDTPNAVAHAGSSGIYVVGATYGSLGGLNAGFQDAFLARYDNSGNLLWIRQLGTSMTDVAYDVAPDSTGGAYVAGYTQGNLGGTNAGNTDPWLARYDSAGTQTWIRQFGTSGYEGAAALASDGAGGVYICGGTSANLGGTSAGGSDAWLARYNSSGTRTWIRQLGSTLDDAALAAAQDGSGGVFVSGRTLGTLGGPGVGGEDVWLARYSSGGTQSWIRHLGSNVEDVVARAAADGSGGVCIGGYTDGNLGGSSTGGRDAWIARFDGAGARSWIGQVGTGASDYAKCLASDGAGGVYAGGSTGGTFGGPSAGSIDGWLARYDATCGTTLTYCTSSTTTVGCAPAIEGLGAASVSAASAFTLRVTGVDGQRSGMIFYGLDNAGWSPLPWASGSTSFLCVKPPTQRSPAQSSGGTLGACDGSLSLDWNAFLATFPGALGTPFAPGALVYAQGWLRDAAAPKTTNLSNGLRFSLCP